MFFLKYQISCIQNCDCWGTFLEYDLIQEVSCDCTTNCELFFPGLLQLVVFLGWILSVGALLFAVFGVFPFQQPDYEYDAVWSSLYSSTYHTIWALGVGWIILACESNHGGKRSCLLYTQYHNFWVCLCLAVIRLCSSSYRDDQKMKKIGTMRVTHAWVSTTFLNFA